MSAVSRLLDPAVVEELNHLALSARNVVQGSITGEHRSPLRGPSVEFRQHRPYVPGDEPRRLDWRILARTDRPYVREYDQESNLRCALLVDCSGSMAYRSGAISKFDYAVRLAAALAYLMIAHTESVGLCLFGQPLRRWIAPRAGPSQLSQLLETLERAQASGRADIAAAMHEAAENLRRRALVIVISDFFDDPARIRQALAHLHHRRHESILCQVTDRFEETFPFRSWQRFRGLEAEPAVLREPALLRQTYLDNFRRHRQSLLQACRLLHSELCVFTTDRPLLEFLRALLQRRPAALLARDTL